MRRRIAAVVAGLVLATAAAATSAAAADVAPAPSPAPVRVTLLPAAGLVNEPVELTDLGVVVGNAGPAGDVGAGHVYPQPSVHPWRWAAGRLQLLPTGNAAQARVEGVNRLGATAGWTGAPVDGPRRAAAWDALGRVRPITVPADTAADVNDRGDLLLGVDSNATPLHLGILTGGGTYVPVDPAYTTVPAGARPVSLNDRRDVVFDVTGPRGTANFLRWRPGGPPSTQIGFGWSLFNLPPCTSDSESGRVAASAQAADTGGPGVQVSMPDGTITPLPGGGGPAFPGCTGHALAETGDVAGWTLSENAPGAVITPVLWRGTRLIRLPGGPGQAVAVNERGQVAGTQIVTPGESPTLRPVFWASATAAPVTLPVPAGWEAAAVTDVNNLGQVLGAVRRADTGAVRAVLWTPR